MSLYISTLMTPKNSTIDATTIQTFSAQMNGSIITAYQIKIYNNDSGTLLYDTTKITLGTPLYDGSTLNVSIPANSITNSQNCKWTLTVWDNASNSTITGETFFKTYGTATVSMTIPSTINSQTYTAMATYSHPQNIGIKKFHFVLYDVNNNILQDSGYIFSANLTYIFNGFINGTTYQIECIVTDQNDIIVSSGKKSFTISYSQPNVDIVPNVTVLNDSGALQVVWGQAVQLAGTISGTYSYINNFIKNNNKALQLAPLITQSNLIDSRNSLDINPLQSYNFTGGTATPINTLETWGINTSSMIINQPNMIQIIDNNVYQINSVSNISYSVNIPLQFNGKFKIQFSSGFTGIFCKLEDIGNGNSYQIGYDGTRFYFNNKGIIVYGQLMTLPIDPIYVDIRPTDILIDGVRIGM